MSRTANTFSPELRERAVRLVLETEGRHVSRWQAVMSIAALVQRHVTTPRPSFPRTPR